MRPDRARAALLLADARLRPKSIRTPMEATEAHGLADRIGLVLILRAGPGMVDGPTHRPCHGTNGGTLDGWSDTDLQQRRRVPVDPCDTCRYGGSVNARSSASRRQ